MDNLNNMNQTNHNYPEIIHAPDPQRNEPKAPRRAAPFAKSTFAAFMAGTLVMGSLMFAADKTNLFTGGTAAQPVAAAVAAPASTAAAASTAAVKTASSIAGIQPNSIADIAQQSGPAVVKIETKIKTSTGASNNQLYNDPFFRQFFGGGAGGRDQSKQDSGAGGELKESGIGSGFIFESSGYILTNEHVIDGADEINVTIQGYEKPFKATLLGSSYDLDLAVLKIEDSNPFPTLSIGNSDDARVGDWVVAIGNPYDFDYTVTAGLLSAKERPITISDDNGTREYKHLIQTDAAINPGNSGGPLLNMNGEVIGINTAVNSQAQGIGFAIPTSTISSVLEQLKNNVTIAKEPSPYIGVSLSDLSASMLNDLKLSGTEGALVADIQLGTPAYTAGIRPYDVIAEINGTKITNAAEVIKLVKAAKVGDAMTFTIIRDGNKQNVTVTIGDKNASSTAQKKN